MLFRAALITLFAALPTSETYTMPAYTFGNGGGSGSSSNYQVNASVGGIGGNPTSANYGLPAGVRASTTAPVPPAPTFANPDSSYARLKITLNVTGLPSDTKYAIAISSDNFVTTNYVQPDQTIGTSFSVASYQTYTAWGGAGGAWILGLANGTTYKVKVAALHGANTGSQFGPTASAATVTPSVTFGLSTSLTGTPPFSSTFTSLPPATVTPANATIITSVTANAMQGGELQIKSQNAGLSSTSKSYTIHSATADLTSAGNGYGAQVTGLGQASGGPLVAASPYDGNGNSVGGLTAALQSFATFHAPITSGSATLSLLAKADGATPAATDYADLLTVTLILSY